MTRRIPHRSIRRVLMATTVIAGHAFAQDMFELDPITVLGSSYEATPIPTPNI